MKLKSIAVLIVLFYMLMLGNLVHAQSSKTVEYPVQQVALMTFVTIPVNGTPRTFVVDTGAQMTLITPDATGVAFRSLVSASGNKNTTSGVGGTVQIVEYKVDISIGDQQMKGVDVLVAPASMDKVSKAVGFKVDGLLGQNVLARFKTMTIDFVNHKMILESK